MIIIDTPAAMALALDQPLDPDVRQLLLTRRSQLRDAPDAARFILVESADTLADVEAAIGMPLILREGADETPNWEWAERHGGIIEVAFIFGDAADVLLVPERDSIDADLIAMLHLHAADDLKRRRATAR